MAKAMEESGLSIRTEETAELVPTAGAAEKQFEIQSAIVIAKRFPRNEDAAFEKLMKSAQRTSFAEEAFYSFPRGGKTIEGPSVNIAREGARCWQNVRYGLEIVRDDDESRQIRGWAWDLETNTKVTAEDDFKKLIYRKDGGWIKPDERDLRELTNRRGAILERNCLLKVLPKDLIEDALARCKETLKKGAEQDPEAARKKIILAFSTLNITPEMLEAKLGHPLAQSSPAEITELRGIYKSIADGNSTWKDYIGGEKKPEKGTVNTDDLKPAKEDNRGHGNEDLKKVAQEPPPPQEPKGEIISQAQRKRFFAVCNKSRIPQETIREHLGQYRYSSSSEIRSIHYDALISWAENWQPSNPDYAESEPEPPPSEEN